jgi:hypothetical protein
MVNVQKMTESEVLSRLAGQQIELVKECPVCGLCFGECRGLR